MKKLLKICTSFLMAVSLTACSSTSGSTSSAAKDGTYTATEKGFGGDVTVTLVVKDGAFDSLNIVGDSESAGYGADAIPVLQQEMTDAKSPEVDSVSGATHTSDAALTAAKSCFEQAGLSYGSTSASATAGEDQTADTDVLVIGLGASGTMAALNAAEAGAKVLAVEATDTIGGMGNAAQGMFAVNSVEQEERYGTMDTDEEYWIDYLTNKSNYLGNAQLIREFVNESKNTVSYLLDKGVNVYLSQTPQQIAHFDQDVVYHRWNNAKPFDILTPAMENAGVDIHMNTTAQSLTTDADGNVTGAVCTQKDGSTLTVTAKSVIVSTGGFSGNEELMREVLGTAYDNSFVMAGSSAPSIDMMWDVGAAKGELLTMNHGVVTTSNLEVADQLTLNTPILWVNGLGQRFMNEDLLKDTVEFSSAVMAQNGIAYTIVDQATVDRWCDTTQENTGTWIHYWDQNGMLDADGNQTIYHAPVDKDTFMADFDTLTADGEGIVSSDLNEIADFIGCDVDTLKTTIDNYNGYVETGNDTEFYKSSEDLVYSVSEGPYYVTRGHSGVLGSLGGVNVTDKFQVLTSDQKVINGLYSTGNDCSGISVAAYVNVEGVGLGFSLTSGRLAGADAAEYALSK
ncbi:MAG: FAD-dependent oxidoreductase [Solobacterium sp.]|jgi:succinate dehydrogenase/fumarate reductase flavoprotein subunit/uncharacterized protein with FMN-binding domain|nr:FAD-dependent oxidoreductase [Solobacterium sp.]MCH4265259.1 FAD-dependent oxidoreductase [Solobacterium sp.]